ncbi:hypothetical protein [Mesorhizobium sp. Cs1321R2N1]|uniref:hypothetical protein n=1 Tax=Mesorhizobium sp. Cs1321R2N1 TaxID=3015174 RepID=UPI00301D0C56
MPKIAPVERLPASSADLEVILFVDGGSNLKPAENVVGPRFSAEGRWLPVAGWTRCGAPRPGLVAAATNFFERLSGRQYAGWAMKSPAGLQ